MRAIVTDNNLAMQENIPNSLPEDPITPYINRLARGFNSDIDAPDAGRPMDMHAETSPQPEQMTTPFIEESGEVPRRWDNGNVRPALRRVVLLLQDKGVNPDKVLEGRWRQLELLPGLLDKDVKVSTLATDTNVSAHNVYNAAKRALNALIEAAYAARVDPEMIPQPKGAPLEGQPPDDPTKIVGPWLGAIRAQRGVTIADLAKRSEVSEMKIRRFLGALARPNSPHIAATIAIEVGFDEQTAQQVMGALAAERRGEYEKARATIARIQSLMDEEQR